LKQVRLEGLLLNNQVDAAFEQFVIHKKKDLLRIARHTQGEYQYSDVMAEAWLLAYELQYKKFIARDFLNPAYQKLLLSHLYQHLVRYTELQVRHAIRLDHTPLGAGQEDVAHPLMRKLVSDEGRDHCPNSSPWKSL
jgi:hypothetical protein